MLIIIYDLAPKYFSVLESCLAPKVTWHLKTCSAPKDHSTPIGFIDLTLTMGQHTWCTWLQCKMWLSVLTLKHQNHSKTNTLLGANPINVLQNTLLGVILLEALITLPGVALSKVFRKILLNCHLVRGFTKMAIKPNLLRDLDLLL